MGKLKGIMFTGTCEKGRIVASTLRPVDIGAAELTRAAGIQKGGRLEAPPLRLVDLGAKKTAIETAEASGANKGNSGPPEGMTAEEWENAIALGWGEVLGGA